MYIIIIITIKTIKNIKYIIIFLYLLTKEIKKSPRDDLTHRENKKMWENFKKKKFKKNKK